MQTNGFKVIFGVTVEIKGVRKKGKEANIAFPFPIARQWHPRLKLSEIVQIHAKVMSVIK